MRGAGAGTGGGGDAEQREVLPELKVAFDATALQSPFTCGGGGEDEGTRKREDAGHVCSNLWLCIRRRPPPSTRGGVAPSFIGVTGDAIEKVKAAFSMHERKTTVSNIVILVLIGDYCYGVIGQALFPLSPMAWLMLLCLPVLRVLMEGVLRI
ncbi:hypothetical protein ZWY2020_046048 [Hordeum vulgare]|nr:hypothetical protein ZWY2020_046048 [Hordeum vulgare]